MERTKGEHHCTEVLGRGCNWRCFNECTAKEESIIMLKDFLAGQAKAMGSVIADSQLLAFSRNMIEETQQKLLR